VIDHRPTDAERSKLLHIASLRKSLPLLTLSFGAVAILIIRQVPDLHDSHWAVITVAAVAAILFLTPLVYLSFFLRCPRCSGRIAIPKCPSCGLRLEESTKRRALSS
jgi:hypothetical protein